MDYSFDTLIPNGRGAADPEVYGARPGIVRPDQETLAEIIDVLMSDPTIDLSAISVRVDSGLVTLSGEVETPLAAASAEDAAWDTPGVVEVHNNLQTLME